MSGKSRMLRKKLGSSCFASICATALSIHPDWAVRNCTKIGTDTLYMETVIGMRSSPWGKNGRTLPTFPQMNSGTGVDDSRRWGSQKAIGGQRNAPPTLIDGAKYLVECLAATRQTPDVNSLPARKTTFFPAL